MKLEVTQRTLSLYAALVNPPTFLIHAAAQYWPRHDINILEMASASLLAPATLRDCVQDGWNRRAGRAAAARSRNGALKTSLLRQWAQRRETEPTHLLGPTLTLGFTISLLRQSAAK